MKLRKSVGLSVPCPSSQDGVELKIVDQPERHHRARYLVEGSRGCVKNEAKVGFPTVQVKFLLHFIFCSGNDVKECYPPLSVTKHDYHIYKMVEFSVFH